jgi:Transposase DDE domain
VQKQEHSKASVRTKVEHPFRVIKRQFGLLKVRFRGLQKNTGQLLTLFALSNLWIARRQLMAMTGVVRSSVRTQNMAENPLLRSQSCSFRIFSTHVRSGSSCFRVVQTFLGVRA